MLSCRSINMRKLTLILVSLFTICACGDVKDNACTVEQVAGGSLVSCPDGSNSFVPNGDQGDQGEPGQDLTPQSDAETDLSGYYILPNAGIADIVKDGLGLYDVSTLLLNTANPNDTLCVLSLPRTNVYSVSGTIVYSSGINLAANNCRSDGNSKLETKSGTTYTYTLSISLNESDKLNVRLVVIQKKNGVATKVIDRTVTEE